MFRSHLYFYLFIFICLLVRAQNVNVSSSVEEPGSETPSDMNLPEDLFDPDFPTTDGASLPASESSAPSITEPECMEGRVLHNGGCCPQEWSWNNTALECVYPFADDPEPADTEEESATRESAGLVRTPVTLIHKDPILKPNTAMYYYSMTKLPKKILWANPYRFMFGLGDDVFLTEGQDPVFYKKIKGVLPGLKVAKNTLTIPKLRSEFVRFFDARKDEDRPYTTYWIPGLSQSKMVLIKTMTRMGIPANRQAVYLIMATIETNRISQLQYDHLKDHWTNGGRNVSPFNFNYDFIYYVGMDPHRVAARQDYAACVQILERAYFKLGLNNMLNFHRGGRTGYNDKVSYGCREYRHSVQTMVKMIARDPKLLVDNRRLDFSLPYV